MTLIILIYVRRFLCYLSAKEMVPSFKDYCDFDNDAFTCGELNDEEIVTDVIRLFVHDIENDNDDNEDQIPIKSINHQKVRLSFCANFYTPRSVFQTTRFHQ